VVRHSPQLIVALKEDRHKGFSISELVERYDIAKTTVWHHIRKVEVPEGALRRIRSQQGGSARRSKERWLLAEKQAKKLLDFFDEEDAWVVLLVALYWAEGSKGSFVFTNTDEKMIRIFLKIIRNQLTIPDKDIDIMIRTCTPMNPIVCRRYWSRITKVPFRYVRINHNDKQNKSKTNFGMCRVIIKKGGQHLKLIHCLIQELTARMLDTP